jgi:ABC-type polysaccharide/polyol phosphate transport system ATPase subunit
MSNNTIIKVEGLSKKYMLNKNVGLKNDTLYGNIFNFFKNLTHKKELKEFWALNNVSFEIEKGDRVGIVGRNGAGKSTLLKILSRITPPTDGRIEITGTVASLLEVGTGFHGDLSGRENIYLNGSILGMSKEEIDLKFNEIVAFSEIENFIDTPVKRYSSGMYVKLAFSIAVHLNPDILILDEVLAVGDAAFQKKCIDKVNELSFTHGRTILFVSHNIASIKSICNKGLYFNQGKLIDYGPIDKILHNYQNLIKETVGKDVNVDVKILNKSQDWEIGSIANVSVTWEKGRFEPGWQCDLAGYTFDGIKLFAFQSQLFVEFNSNINNLSGISFLIKNIGYAPSDIRIDIGIKTQEDQPYSVLIENCATLSPSTKNLPLYKRDDVITIPEVSCQTITY